MKWGWVEKKAKKTLDGIRQRTMNPKSNAYHRYGGRGIKCLITWEELAFMLYRDEADQMECASIERINNDGNYEFNNCCFIEKKDNKRILKEKCPYGHPYSGVNLIIKKNGSRHCRECAREKNRLFKKSKQVGSLIGGKPKISFEIALEIREKNKLGAKQKDLAYEYKLSTRSIAGICSGNQWGRDVSKNFERK